MILLRMFFDFEVEILEVLEGFEAWFLQSFCTFECFWIFFDAAYALNGLVCWNALRRLLFIGVWEWVSDTWWSLIGDTCHNLIGPLMSSLTHVGLHMPSLTCVDVWLVFACILCLYFNDTWKISVGFWVVIVKPSSSTWRFVITFLLLVFFKILMVASLHNNAQKKKSCIYLF